jgi:hypothetical protein
MYLELGCIASSYLAGPAGADAVTITSRSTGKVEGSAIRPFHFNRSASGTEWIARAWTALKRRLGYQHSIARVTTGRCVTDLLGVEALRNSTASNLEK